jgi:arginine/lysine/ornithine decarboxylase
MKHAGDNPASFHVPGHQSGQVWRGLRGLMPHRAKDEWTQTFAEIMKLDVTELSSTDDLHHPEASIKEAQRLAAQAYDADATYFLVGGSTSGNLAMLLAVCDPGDLVIVQRNVHKSVINGLRLAGANAVFVTPRSDARTGLAVAPSVEQIEEALRRYPMVKAVFLSNPNYYGLGVELERYADAIHRYGIPLLVDEAHGAHYGHHPELPLSAMQAGADAAVQSTHKTLPALTMGAMLHVQGERLNRERLEQALALVQSSSPSFPIMATLDISRAMITSFGEAMFQSAISHALELRSWLQETGMLIQDAGRASDQEIIRKPDNKVGAESKSSWLRDPLRIVLHDSTGRLSGHQLKKELEERGCWAEMSDSAYVVLLIGAGTSREQMERLKEAVLSIHRHLIQVVAPSDKSLNRQPDYSLHADTAMWRGDLEAIGEPVSFEGGWYRNDPSIRVPVREALGKRAAEMVVPYPPGIPLLYAGEKLTGAHIAQIERLASQGANFQGARDPRMETIAVYID